MTAFERAELCHELADAVKERIDGLVEWLSADQGKPLAEAEGEVDLVATTFREAGENAKRANTEVMPSQHPEKEVKTLRKPHSVYGVITPWDFLLGTAIEYLAHGIAIGNTVVWAPAPMTTAVCAKFVEVLAETSLPDGVLNFVTGDGPVVGDEFVVNNDVGAIAFTGSTATGAEISSESGFKPTVL